MMRCCKHNKSRANPIGIPDDIIPELAQVTSKLSSTSKRTSHFKHNYHHHNLSIPFQNTLKMFRFVRLPLDLNPNPHKMDTNKPPRAKLWTR